MNRSPFWATIGSQKVVNRIYYVEFSDSFTVDHCYSLLDCGVNAPPKQLIWARDDNTQLDGLSWGPILKDGRRSIAMAFDNDEKVGVHFELFAFNEELLVGGEVYN